MKFRREFAAEGHEVKNVGIGEIYTFLVELIVGDLHSLDGFSHDSLVHDVRGDLLHKVLVFLFHSFSLNHWELMNCEHRTIALDAVPARRHFFQSMEMPGFLRKSLKNFDNIISFDFRCSFFAFDQRNEEEFINSIFVFDIRLGGSKEETVLYFQEASLEVNIIDGPVV